MSHITSPELFNTIYMYRDNVARTMGQWDNRTMSKGQWDNHGTMNNRQETRDKKQGIRKQGTRNNGKGTIRQRKAT